MKLTVWLALSSSLVLSACQNSRSLSATIVDGDQVQRVIASTDVPRSLLDLAGFSLGPADTVLCNGYPVDPDMPLSPAESITLQVQRAISVTLNGQAALTTARSVGEVVRDSSTVLYAADLVDPPTDTPLEPGMLITHTPSGVVTVSLDGKRIQVRSAANTVGASIAEGGVPLIGLDRVQPSEGEPRPADGEARLTRIAETLVLVQEQLPYNSTFHDSADIELGLERIVQPGLNGVALTRSTIRYEDGVEVARREEPRAVVKPAQDRIVARGSKIVEKTANLDGVTFQYWRELQMYATVYSPCNSATGDAGGCSYGTASGLRAGKGVVAVDPSLFASLNGQRLYIPGYGHAVIGDVGGGFIVERNLGVSRYKWIDLGFDDDNLVDMTGWITVYFLTPSPTSIPDVLK